MRLFIGLDVSLSKTAICVVSEHGKIIKEAETASEPEMLVRWLVNLDGSIAVVAGMIKYKPKQDALVPGFWEERVSEQSPFMEMMGGVRGWLCWARVLCADVV